MLTSLKSIRNLRKGKDSIWKSIIKNIRNSFFLAVLSALAVTLPSKEAEANCWKNAYINNPINIGGCESSKKIKKYRRRKHRISNRNKRNSHRAFFSYFKVRWWAKQIINLAKKRRILWAWDCSKWVDQVFRRATGKSVYKSHTIYNGVIRVSYWTHIWGRAASSKIVSYIKAWDHLMLDRAVRGRYNRWKTHSAIALWSAHNWRVRVISYSWWRNWRVREEIYNLIGWRWWRPWRLIRLQRI